jgi:methyltransferase (TIGR00027 family)
MSQTPRMVGTVLANDETPTGNDSFDISTGAGYNSLFVAAARALEAQRDQPLAVDPYAEYFCRAVGGDWADVLDGRAPDHRLESEFGEVFQSFLGARTKFFDDYFRRASDDGVRQIVILAAGLDSRAYRLTWPEGTVIFELDQPEVLEFKRAVLTDHDASPTTERREIAVDLRENWPKSLLDRGFDSTKPSAWLAEGIMMYLPGSVQEQLCGGIDSLARQAVTWPWRRCGRYPLTCSKPNAPRSTPKETGRGSFSASFPTSFTATRSSGSAITVGTPRRPWWPTTSGKSGARYLPRTPTADK